MECPDAPRTRLPKRNLAYECKLGPAMLLPMAYLVLANLLWTDEATAAAATQTTRSGPVTATVTLIPDQPTIGDEVVFELKVEATAGVEVLMPEFDAALGRFTVLEYVPKQYIADDGATTWTQRYTLQPYMSGEQSIPPILVEFVDHRPGQPPAPEDYDAYELLTQRVDFTVKSVVPESAAAELKPPLGALELESPRASWLPWGVTAAMLLLLAFVVAAVWWTGKARRRSLRRNAYDLARQQVDRLVRDREAAVPQMSIEQFYVEISSAIRQYLENRFELRAPELTTDEFLQLAAAQSALSPEHQQLLAEFLTQADRVKFASGALANAAATDRDVRRSCDLAIRFLEETRENAPDVEVPQEPTHV